MAENNTHETKIVINGDDKGAVSALTRVKSLLNGGVVSALNGVRSAISKVTSALGVIGLAINGINMVIDAYKKVREWMNRTETAAKALRDQIERNNYADSVMKSAEAYKRLNNEIAESLKLERERSEILSGRKKTERDIEDANAERRKQMEISRLDPTDKNYASSKKEIERRYQEEASDSTATRAREDVRSKTEELYGQARTKDREENLLRIRFIEQVKVARKAYGIYDTEYFKAQDAGEDPTKSSTVSKAKSDLDKAVEFAKKIKEEMKAAGAEAARLRRQAGEVSGGELSAKIKNQADRQRLSNEAKEEEAERKKKNKEEADKEKENKLKLEQNIEDKKLERLKQEDMSFLDPNDPKYDIKKKEIENRYEVKEAEYKRNRAKTPEERAAAEEEIKAIQIRQYREKQEAENGRIDSYESRILGNLDSSRQKDRLTAMGLGSGSGVDNTAKEQASNVKELVKLFKEQISISRQNAKDNVAVYS